MGCVCPWVPRRGDGTPWQGFALPLPVWRQARDGRAAGSHQGSAKNLGFDQTHWPRWGQGPCALSRSRTSRVGFTLCPGVSGYHPACLRDGWQQPGCQQPGQSWRLDGHSMLPPRPCAQGCAGSWMPGDVQACPKASKKSLSHPKHSGGLAHLPWCEVRSRQASVPLGHRKPCPKRLYG